MRHIIWVSAMSLVMVACGGGSSAGGSGTSGSAPANSASGPSGAGTGTLGNAVGLVVDSSGNGVSNAVFGAGNMVTDVNGGAVGTLSQSAVSGWTAVSAQGYATGYVKPAGKAIKGWHVLNEVRLTPIADTLIHDTSSGDTLTAGNPSDPDVEAVLDAGLFTQDSVVVQLAALDPTTVGPAYAPLSDKAALHLNKAFFVSAQDGAGNEVPFATGATAKVTVRDGGSLGSQFELASFNAKTGAWDVLAGACHRADKNHVQCTLPHFSTWGLFGANSPPPSGDAYQQAAQGLKAAVHRMFAHPNQNGIFPQYVLDAAAKLGQAALDYAAGHPTDQAIHRLLTADADAQLLGMGPLSQKLFDAASKVESRRAETLLKNTKQCALVRPLVNMAADAMLLGDNKDASALQIKVDSLASDCHLWRGTIRYTFIIPASWPTSTALQASGPHSWSEIHSVHFDLNPKTNQLQGDDMVRTHFAKAGFQSDAGPTCGGESRFVWQAYADPDPGQIYLTFKGTYDPTKKQFAVTAPAVTNIPGESTQPAPVSLAVHNHFYNWRSEGSNCIAAPLDGTAKRVSGYTSMLVDAFNGAPQGPSIAEMLNAGAKHQGYSGTLIRGQRIVNVGVPPSFLPLAKVIVRWNFAYLPNQFPPP